MIIRKLTLLAGLSLLFTACTDETSTDETPFEDEALKDAVAEEAGGNGLSENDLSDIQSLDASGAGITSLEGIGSLPNLRDFNLSHNDINDFSPLLSLENLENLHAGDLFITVESEGSKLEVLEELEENGVEIEGRTRLAFEDTYDGPSKGVFYRVEENGQTVYLFGSVHVGDEEMYPLHNDIEEAFQEADYLAVEIDTADVNEMEASQVMMEHGTYTDGTSLSDVVDDEIYEEAADRLAAYGLNEAMINQFKPWFVSMMLSDLALEETDYRSEEGIDMHFIERAHESGLPVISLESIESQIESLSSAPEEEQVESLEEMVKQFDIYEEELETMINVWKAGNTDIFAQLREMDGDTDQLAMDERDEDMTAQIEEFLSDDSGDTYFVVVGALHLAGENSIPDLLTERGYSVEAPEDFQ
ncbi:TraB/GumN family protein [Salipaludibacillus aurantiacus]|uniref:TraB family protein n=1 Tax=Salipaludibacillus aurantiacus TaxID=1601833 RepID=A0A1H9SI59_9BACI|nr:TraB/GumN family protein [Salipaludibacillus aurantiacus]SER83919.1 hypothetical protein SAMN05518684_104203 [Salipaludibacillus aurantiacus]